MKSQPTFVRSDRAVHLDPEPAVDVDLALVVLPWHPKHDDTFRLDDALEHFGFPVMRISIQHQGERLVYFLHRLVKLGFARVFGLHLGHQIRNVIFHERRKLWQKTPRSANAAHDFTTQRTQRSRREETDFLIRNPGRQEKSDRIYKILQNHRRRLGFCLNHVDSVNSVSVQSGWSLVTDHLSLLLEP